MKKQSKKVTKRLSVKKPRASLELRLAKRAERVARKVWIEALADLQMVRRAA